MACKIVNFLFGHKDKNERQKEVMENGTVKCNPVVNIPASTHAAIFTSAVQEVMISKVTEVIDYDLAKMVSDKLSGLDSMAVAKKAVTECIGNMDADVLANAPKDSDARDKFRRTLYQAVYAAGVGTESLFVRINWHNSVLRNGFDNLTVDEIVGVVKFNYPEYSLRDLTKILAAAYVEGSENV